MATTKRDDEATLLRSFLRWMAERHQAGLCVPGYAGEMMESGKDDEYIDEFVAEPRN